MKTFTFWIANYNSDRSFHPDAGNGTIRGKRKEDVCAKLKSLCYRHRGAGVWRRGGEGWHVYYDPMHKVTIQYRNLMELVGICIDTVDR